jgi:hypothetical protein
MQELGTSNRPTKLPQAEWTVYYDVQTKTKRCSSKDEFLKQITTAGACQDRGALEKIMAANRIEPKDATKVNFRCFRCHVQPLWEVFALLENNRMCLPFELISPNAPCLESMAAQDPSNARGGSAMWRFSKKYTASKLMCTVMDAIMNNKIVDAEKVNGVVLSTRKRWGHLLSIWCSIVPSEQMQNDVVQVLLSLDPKFVCCQSETKQRSRPFSDSFDGDESDPSTPSDDRLSAAPTPDVPSSAAPKDLGVTSSAEKDGGAWQRVTATPKGPQKGQSGFSPLCATGRTAAVTRSGGSTCKSPFAWGQQQQLKSPPARPPVANPAQPIKLNPRPSPCPVAPTGFDAFFQPQQQSMRMSLASIF